MGVKNLDITGQSFGNLKVIRPSDKRSGASILWECLCSCGNTIYVRRSSLFGDSRYKGKTSCGCLFDHVGDKFGKLTIISRNKDKYLCLCGCGNHTNISRTNFGTTQSCGCIRTRNIKTKENKKMATNTEKFVAIGHFLDLLDIVSPLFPTEGMLSLVEDKETIALLSHLDQVKKA